MKSNTVRYGPFSDSCGVAVTGTGITCDPFYSRCTGGIVNREEDWYSLCVCVCVRV